MTIGGAVEELRLTLSAPGRHNLLNALAAMAVAAKLGIPSSVVAGALAGFTGADRRFQRHHARGAIEVIDDYGHHPTEITAVLETARLQAPHRLIVVFQPHRYTRTARLLDRFGPALALADELIVTDVYAAGEAPIAGADQEAVAAAVRRHSTMPIQLAASLEDAVERAVASARAGDVVVTLGAGSVGRLAPQIVDALNRRSA